MGQPYVGEIRMFAGNFAPVGWMFCQGQLLPISEEETLFNLIGTTYGGDGQSTFALPDLRGRVPLHMGNPPSGGSFVIGENGGVETVTLTQQQIPQHTHALQASNAVANAATPQSNLTGQAAAKLYHVLPPSTGPVFLNPQSVTSTGGSQPHQNMQPYLCVSFIISLFGIFPSQT